MAASPSLAFLFTQRVVVGVGDMAVANNPQITLSTYALGSCVAVAAYDPALKAGGLLHLMLPDSSISPAKASAQPAMFANTGLPLLFRALNGIKVERSRMRLILAGGASMLCNSDMFKIGERNIKAVSDYLGANGYSARHSVLGGTNNRTLHLDLATGAVKIKGPNAIDAYSLGA